MRAERCVPPVHGGVGGGDIFIEVVLVDSSLSMVLVVLVVLVLLVVVLVVVVLYHRFRTYGGVWGVF